MKKSSKKSEAEILRQKAEEVIKSMLPVKNALRSWMTEADALKLIHELEVHQIELGLQNDELILAKEQAEIASKKYAELYDFSPAGYFTLSKEGKIIELNLSGSQMLGKERAHLIKSSFGFFVSHDTKKTFNHFLGKVFKSKAKETCEVTLSLNDDLPVYVQLTGIVSDNGEQCLMTIVDITEQKQALKSAGISIRQKNLILEATGEGILGIDLAGNHTFVNPMAVEILGYSIEELLGKNPHTLFHHHHRDGAYYPAEDCPIINTLMSGKPAIGEEYFWRKDGTGFPIEFSSLPIIEDYQITGAVVTFRDISAHKQAEEDARKAYEILEATLDALPDVLFDVGLDGYCYDVHSPRTELLNRPDRDIIGKTIANIFPPAISGIIMAAIQEAHEKGFSLGRQYELKVPLGTFWFELSVSRKVSAPDSPPRFIILRRDITERKQAYNALRRS